MDCVPLTEFNFLKQRVIELENRIEESELYYEASMLSKKSIEEITEMACIGYFEVKKKDFRDKVFDKIGDPTYASDYDKQVIASRQWFMSIMTNMLHRTSHSMKVNYKFFHYKKMISHRPVYLSAINPGNEKSHQHRETLMAILSEIRKMMKEERVFDVAFE